MKSKPVLMILIFLLSASFFMVSSAEEADESFFSEENRTLSVETTAPQEAMETPVPESPSSGGMTVITLTAVGDVTIGRNVQYSGSSIFNTELEKQNNDVNFIFRNVKDIFEEDDVTIANFEGVLADEYKIPSNKKNNSFLFIAPYSFASVLKDNSVEMVTIENNHTGDFGEDGLLSTQRAIEETGVQWANASHSATYTVKGITITLLAYQTLNQPISSSELKNIVDSDIKAARETSELVVVYFHWGEEKDYAPRDNQVMLGRAAIDSGADLVLGAHSHRINPIEKYQDKYIVYSLANCSFAGNSKPSDMNTFIFQTQFKFRNGELVKNPFRIIPCRISSRKDKNDFAITPYTELTDINRVINNMKENGKKLTYAVEEYPLDWE